MFRYFLINLVLIGLSFLPLDIYGHNPIEISNLELEESATIDEEWNKVISSNPKILDYDTAVQRTLNQSLNLNLSEYEIQAREGQIKQARSYPNPQFSYSLETSGYKWPYREEIYAVSQLIELGGKRHKNIEIASYEYYAALSGYEAVKLERLNHLTKAFIQVVTSQELLKVSINRQRNAKEFLQQARNKLEIGKGSLIECHKAEIAKTFADLTMKKNLTAFEISKKELSLVWSSLEADFDLAVYPFFEAKKPEPFEKYLSKLCAQPEICLAKYKHLASYHNLRAVKAQRIPDLTLTLGYSNDQGDSGVVAGVAFPLPIFNQNQGNIKTARYEMLKTEDEAKQLRLLLESKLTNFYTALTKEYQEIEELKNIALKASEKTVQLAFEGYQEGKFSYQEVLEAKQIFFDMQEKYIEALARYHKVKAALDYLNLSL